MSGPPFWAGVDVGGPRKGFDVAAISSRDEVADQVRITVVHEGAHHFGIDDDRLRELGYG